MIFGKRLREMRMKRSMTQQSLADAIHVELRSYQCYEQGTRQPSLKLIIALADILDVSTDYLLGRDEFLNKQQDEQLD